MKIGLRRTRKNISNGLETIEMLSMNGKENGIRKIRKNEKRMSYSIELLTQVKF